MDAGDLVVSLNHEASGAIDVESVFAHLDRADALKLVIEQRMDVTEVERKLAPSAN